MHSSTYLLFLYWCFWRLGLLDHYHLFRKSCISDETDYQSHQSQSHIREAHHAWHTTYLLFVCDGFWYGWFGELGLVDYYGSGTDPLSHSLSHMDD